MPDRDTRAEIARIGLVECITETDNVFPESWEWESVRRSAERIADALLAAGLVVPSGLTAEKLGQCNADPEDSAYAVGHRDGYADARSDMTVDPVADEALDDEAYRAGWEAAMRGLAWHRPSDHLDDDPALPVSEEP